jgi:2,3-bisphosphoglycerate-dependent phosphoglycerate mutase
MTLAIVRHGQSTFNLQNRFTGDLDVPLTLHGKHEALLAGEALRETGVEFQDSFSSSLLRSVESMKVILEEIDPTRKITQYQSAALNERNYGSLQGLNKSETEQIYSKEKVNEWRRNFYSKPPEGESLEDTYKRVIQYFKDVIEPLLLSKHNILIVAHGNSLRALMMYLEHISPKDIESTEIQTGVPVFYDVQESNNFCLRYRRKDSTVLP